MSNLLLGYTHTPIWGSHFFLIFTITFGQKDLSMQSTVGYVLYVLRRKAARVSLHLRRRENVVTSRSCSYRFQSSVLLIRAEILYGTE
jgi:hypothetical protein